MATQDDYVRETERLAEIKERERTALRIAQERHGGANPMPGEPSVPAIIAQFGDWAVTPFGVECLTNAYQIQWDSITDAKVDDDFWLSNLSKKDWVNLEEFINALHQGRKIHRYLQGLSQNNQTEDIG